jgi:ATP phosphoribosyltransferase regulatory subunit
MRDVLPDEMRELRALTGRLRESFEEAGYGEIWTPALEYEAVLRTGDQSAAGAGYRLFDESGEVLVLRSDGTIPIARMVASRFAEVEGALRLCYFAHAYRAAERRAGESREFLQGGLELIGVPGAEGEAEVLALTFAALDRAGLRRQRVGVGDGSLYRAVLDDLDVPQESRGALLECLSRQNLVGLEQLVRRLGLSAAASDLLVGIPRLRGGPEVLDRAEGPLSAAVEGLRELHALLSDRGAAERVIFDLGLVRELGYYTGTIFEVYDPAVGFALGGGGRYDDLIGRFGEPRPACGVAFDVERVHIAKTAEERAR